MRFLPLISLAVLAIGPATWCCASPDTRPIPIRKEALEEAALRANTENKHMLVAFLGEGWSISCRKFKEQILSTADFKEFADANLIYLPVEARRKPKLSSKETAVLQSWVIHFNVKSYPTVILIAPDGQELLRHGFKDLNAKEYLELLKAILPMED